MKILEKYVKQEIPYDKNLIEYDLGKLGKSVILYEKAYYTWIRADVSIFSHNKGLICIEIKNKHDTLKRLPKELKGYSVVANYIYVYTARNHLKGVSHIIKTLNMQNYVGIIVYDQINGIIVPGLVKSAHYNNRVSIRALLWVMWRSELLRLLISNYGHQKYQMSKDLSFHQFQKAKQSFFPNTKYPRKRTIINKLLFQFGPAKCSQLVNDMFINNDQDPEKHINKSLFH